MSKADDMMPTDRTIAGCLELARVELHVTRSRQQRNDFIDSATFNSPYRRDRTYPAVERMHLRAGTYQNGRLALVVLDSCGQTECKLTVNLVDVPVDEGEFFLLLHETPHDVLDAFLNLSLCEPLGLIDSGQVVEYAQRARWRPCAGHGLRPEGVVAHSGDLRVTCQRCLADIARLTGESRSGAVLTTTTRGGW